MVTATSYNHGCKQSGNMAADDLNFSTAGHRASAIQLLYTSVVRSCCIAQPYSPACVVFPGFFFRFVNYIHENELLLKLHKLMQVVQLLYVLYICIITQLINDCQISKGVPCRYRCANFSPSELFQFFCYIMQR